MFLCAMQGGLLIMPEMLHQFMFCTNSSSILLVCWDTIALAKVCQDCPCKFFSRLQLQTSFTIALTEVSYDCPSKCIFLLQSSTFLSINLATIVLQFLLQIYLSIAFVNVSSDRPCKHCLKLHLTPILTTAHLRTFDFPCGCHYKSFLPLPS